MPIYKISSPEKVVSSKDREYSSPSAATTWNSDGLSDHGNTSSGKMTFMELTEADREQERPVNGKVEMSSGSASSPGNSNVYYVELRQKGGGGQSGPAKPETIIEKEIREQREREEELEAIHKAVEALKESRAAASHPPESPVAETSSTGKAASKSEAPAVKESAAAPASSAAADDDKPKAAKQSSNRPGGEKRMLQEMAELQVREEELRMYRKEIGIVQEKKDASTAVTVSNAKPPSPAPAAVTKEAQSKDTGVSNAKPSSPGAAIVTKEGQTKDKNAPNEKSPSPAPLLVIKEGQQSKDKVNAQMMSSPSKSPASFAYESSVTTCPSPKVQPFEDAEQIRFGYYTPYIPRSDSLMEREIKVAKDREAELRQFRGLLPSSTAEEDEVEVRPLQTSDEKPDKADLSKQYAENRMRTELHREKQKEMALYRNGMIRTLSEHHKGDPFVQDMWIPPDTEELREYTRSLSVQRESSSSADQSDVFTSSSPKAGSETKSPSTTTGKTTDTKSPPPPSTTTGKSTEIKSPPPPTPTSTTAGKGSTSNAVPPSFIQPAQSPSPSTPTKSKETPPVLSTYSYSSSTSTSVTGDGGKDADPDRKSEAEKRIEQEVEEARRRESELRDFRRSLLMYSEDEMSSSSHTPPPSDESRSKDQAQNSTNEDEYDWSQSPGKLSIIGDWEKKISKS